MTREREAHPSLEQRTQPGRLRSIVLAVLVHAAFFALIVFGITWQSSPTAPVEAELWKDLPPMAKAQSPKPPEPEPPKPEPPKPEPPKPEPPKPEPPKEVKPEPPKPDPSIALKAEREKREREKAEREKAEREKAEREKAEKARLEKRKEEAEKKKREKDEADRKKREEEQRKREEEQARVAAERARAEAAAAQKREVDAYSARIQAKIKAAANVPDTVPTGTTVEVRLHILPGGEVLDIQVTKRSGNPSYDAAIERAIRSAQPLPVPPAGSELFPQFRNLILNFRHER